MKTETEIDEVITWMANEHSWLRVNSAEGLLHEWRAFVNDCVKGYSEDIYEFENDRAVRSIIDQVGKEPRAVATAQFGSFQAMVAEEDKRYRKILFEDIFVADTSSPWWIRGVPSYAGRDLALSYLELFGIRVRIVADE